MKTAGKSVLVKEKKTQILSLKNTHKIPPTPKLSLLPCKWMEVLHESTPSSLVKINNAPSPTPEPCWLHEGLCLGSSALGPESWPEHGWWPP